MAKLLLAGALMRMAGAFLAEIQLAVRAVAQKHREEASGKRVQDWQAGARLARRCKTGKEMHDGRGVARRTSTAAPGQPGAWLATRCTMEEALHGWQACARTTFVWVVR